MQSQTIEEVYFKEREKTLVQRSKEIAEKRILEENLDPEIFKCKDEKDFTWSKQGIDIRYLDLYGNPRIELTNKARNGKITEAWFNQSYIRTRLSFPNGSQKYNQRSKEFVKKPLENPIAFLRKVINYYASDDISVETLILTEGEIKSQVLCNYDILSIGFPGISIMKITAEIKQLIQKKNFKKIGLLYDGDCKDPSTKEFSNDWERKNQFYSSALNLINSVINELFPDWPEGKEKPEFFLITNKTDHKKYSNTYKAVDDILKGEKDPDLKNAIKKDLKELNKESEFFEIQSIDFNYCATYNCNKFFDLTADSRKDKGRILKGEELYLEPILKRYKIGFQDIINHNIISPTGSGKSSLIRSFAKENKIIVMVPSIALREDYKREALNLNIGIDVFDPDNFTSQEKVLESNLIVSCYQSFIRLIGNLGESAKEFHLIIDESHNFTSSTNKEYLLDELNMILDHHSVFKSFTLFTATDLPVFDQRLLLPKITIQLKRSVKKFVHVVNKQKCDYNDLINFWMNKQGEEDSLKMIVFNNKGSELHNFKNKFNKKGIKTNIFNADTRKQNPFRELLESGTIEEEGISIVTNVLKEGINILNHKKKVFIFFRSSLHHAEIEQFTSRFRNAEEVHIFLVNRMNPDERFSFIPTSRNLIDHTKNYVRLIRAESRLSHLPISYLDKAKKVLFDEHPTKLIGENIEICYLRLQNQIFNWERNFYVNNTNLICYELEKIYNYSVIKEEDFPEKTKDPEEADQPILSEEDQLKLIGELIGTYENSIDLKNDLDKFREEENTDISLVNSFEKFVVSIGHYISDKRLIIDLLKGIESRIREEKLNFKRELKVLKKRIELFHTFRSHPDVTLNEWNQAFLERIFISMDVFTSNEKGFNREQLKDQFRDHVSHFMYGSESSFIEYYGEEGNRKMHKHEFTQGGGKYQEVNKFLVTFLEYEYKTAHVPEGKEKRFFYSEIPYLDQILSYFGIDRSIFQQQKVTKK
jgi:hypothetical protein